MRVATFNVRHGVAPGRRRPDLDRLARSVAGLDADVVGIQEVDRCTDRCGGADQPAAIEAASGGTARFARAIDVDGGEYGVVLLARMPLVAVRTIALPSRSEDRVAVLARVPDPATIGTGASWAVGCTHLSTRPDEAARDLRVVLDELDGLADGRPAVLLGDMNLEADAVRPVVDAGWTAVPTGPTHPSIRPRRRIDWILLRRARWVDVAVPDVRASDHRPIVADVVPAPA